MPVDRHRETLLAFVSAFVLTQQPIFETEINNMEKKKKGVIRNSFRPFRYLWVP